MAKKEKKKRSRLSIIVSKVVSIALLIGAIFLSVNVLNNILTMASLQKRSQEVEEQLKLLQDEHASLISTKTKLEDPNYIQTYARGEYMFSKGDEKIFYLPSSSDE